MIAVVRLRQKQKQIPHCVPRAPYCGAKEKARDFVRDDSWMPGRRKAWKVQSQVLLLDLGHGVGAGEYCVEHFVFAQTDVFEEVGLDQQDGLHADHFQDC